jgi:hypothetical protein
MGEKIIGTNSHTFQRRQVPFYGDPVMDLGCFDGADGGMEPSTREIAKKHPDGLCDGQRIWRFCNLFLLGENNGFRPEGPKNRDYIKSGLEGIGALRRKKWFFSCSAPPPTDSRPESPLYVLPPTTQQAASLLLDLSLDGR